MLDIEIGAQETQIDPANSSALKIPAGLSLELFGLFQAAKSQEIGGFKMG